MERRQVLLKGLVDRVQTDGVVGELEGGGGAKSGAAFSGGCVLIDGI